MIKNITNAKIIIIVSCLCLTILTLILILHGVFSEKDANVTFHDENPPSFIKLKASTLLKNGIDIKYDSSSNEAYATTYNDNSRISVNTEMYCPKYVRVSIENNEAHVKVGPQDCITSATLGMNSTISNENAEARISFDIPRDTNLNDARIYIHREGLRENTLLKKVEEIPFIITD